MFALTIMRQRQSIFSNQILGSQLAVRGAKKKKGGAPAAAPLSNDIVNIFKDKQDAPVYPTEAYPPWLTDLLKP